MAKKTRRSRAPEPADTQGSPASFDTAIRDALRRGLEEQTGTGARMRVVSRSLAGPSVWRRRITGLLGSVSKREIFAFCQELALLLECGMPLVRALNTVAGRIENYTLARAILAVADRVEEGGSFTEAVTEQSRYFPAVLINMFRAGEQSGDLIHALYDVAEHGERLTTARHKALASLIYPAVLIVVAFGVITVAFGWSMGQFKDFFDELKIPIPWTMQVLMTFGEKVRTAEFWMWLVGGVAGVVVLCKLLMRLRAVRLLRDRLLLRCPGMRYFVQQGLIANFSRVFAIMIQGGVSLDEALQACHETADNEVLRLTIERVRQNVREGRGMTEAFERGGVFPPLAYDLSGVAEEAGALGRIFDKMAHVYEEKLETDTAVVGRIIQPLVVVLLAVVVGFIMVGFLSTYATLFTHVSPSIPGT